MAPHSSTLAWKTPWAEEPGEPKSMGLLRVRHRWATSRSLFTFMHWRRKWQPTPVFFFFVCGFFKIIIIIVLIILLCNTVLVLPYINMNPPWVYMSSQSWAPLPPPSPYHLSVSSQCTSPNHPVSCIEPRLAIHFLHDVIHLSMPFSQIIPPAPWAGTGPVWLKSKSWNKSIF